MATVAALPQTDTLSELFGAHHRRVLRAAYRITGSVADAEDVTQAVFLRLARDREQVKNAASYLYRAAINGSIDLLRSRRSGSTEPLEQVAAHLAAGTHSSPDTEAWRRELGAELRKAIGELSPRAAEMVTLRYLEELSNREIAELMGTSQAVVAVTLHSARSKLKKRLLDFERA